MNRRFRVITVLVIAVAMAAAASLGVYRLIQSRPIREVEVAHTFVVVAAKTLPMGTLVKAEDVKRVAWPSISPVPGAFDKIESVVDRGLVSAVVANEPLTNSKLAPTEAGAGLPPSIPTGMRAISVRVNEVIGVAGFVVPGTRVDVLVTMSDNAGSVTRVVVSNVLVLTAGTRYDQERAKPDPIPSSVVTLMATPKDAERIALAVSQGQLMLTLRNPLDTDPTDTTGVRTGSLFSGDAPAATEKPVQRSQTVKVAPPPAPEPPPVPKIYTVETIRAAKRTEEVVH